MSLNLCDYKPLNSIKALLAYIGIFSLILPTLHGETDFKSVKDLKDRYEGAYDLLIEPVHDLNKKYLEALERLLEQKSNAGQLEFALGVKNEIEGFGDGRAFSHADFQSRSTTIPDLQRLKDTYLRQRKTTFRHLQKPISELERKYIGNLEQFANEQTRLQNFDVALVAKEEIERVRNSGGPMTASRLFDGRIKFIAKGEIDIWINGEKESFRNSSKDEEYIVGETRPTSFTNGDLIQVEVSGTAVYRSFIAYLESDDGKRFVALKSDDFRIGESKHMREDVSHETIESLATGPKEGPFDPNMANFWSNFEIPDNVRSQCQWIKIQSSTDPNYYVAVVDGSKVIDEP